MKIRMIQAGWETYTGNFGGVEFADGTSIADVLPREASRLANIVQIEQLDGTNPSASQQDLDSKCTPMQVQGEEPAPAPRAAYTQDELEEIAGTGGIKALRVVGDPLGVKASGIADLIALILAAQAPVEVAPVAPAAPAEAAVTTQAAE
jgi:hypothetical protein